MRAVIFTRSPGSGDRGGTFMRGVVAELVERGFEVKVLTEGLSLDIELEGTDLVLVAERIEPELARRIGRHRARHGGYRLLFHDTRGRALTAPEAMARYDLGDYDGVLAPGEVVRRAYLERGWAGRAWTWHEAADTRVFRPIEGVEPEADLVWLGDWGDRERRAELDEFLLRPARRLRLHGSVHGDRFSRRARLRLRLSGLRNREPVPASDLPALYARHRLTVHIPRRRFVDALPGIPTIRPFEAMACGIPLISSPWDDCEGLFRVERDYLLARDAAETREAMQAIVEYPELAAKLRESGLETIRARHTCAHRVDELLAIDAELRGLPAVEALG